MAERGLHVLVAGAGAIGCWTALHLLRKGARVTLSDPWGAGNSRSSSGGETRIIRGAYGGQSAYIDWTAKSFPQWKTLGEQHRQPLFTRCGVLWLFGEDDSFVTDSLPVLKEHGIPIEKLDAREGALRFPQFRWDDVQSAYYEPQSGYLLARKACRLLLQTFLVEGGTVRPEAVYPVFDDNGQPAGVKTSDGETLEADRYVFTAGPWLPQLFPNTLGECIKPTRQEVFYFGTPAGNSSFNDAHMPVWIEMIEGDFYGIPGNEDRGLKISGNKQGELVDPTTLNRLPTRESVESARRQLTHRFPAMDSAPLLESRVCQYENTPDRDLILDFHPQSGRFFLAGGGSGHAFKMGPALGEWIAGAVMNEEPLNPAFLLSRFDPPSERHQARGNAD